MRGYSLPKGLKSETKNPLGTKARTKDTPEERKSRYRQSLAKTSNFVIRDDVSKDEQGLNVRPLFRHTDYFASEYAKV